jgi:hypothetical protein
MNAAPPWACIASCHNRRPAAAIGYKSPALYRAGQGFLQYEPRFCRPLFAISYAGGSAFKNFMGWVLQENGHKKTLHVLDVPKTNPSAL